MPESTLPISDPYNDRRLSYPVRPSLMQLIQIHAEHLYAVHASSFIMEHSLLPSLPNLLRRLTVDLPTKPPHPTSTANTSHLQPLPLQSWAIEATFAREPAPCSPLMVPLARPIRWFSGSVTKLTCLVDALLSQCQWERQTLPSLTAPPNLCWELAHSLLRSFV